MYWQRIAFHIVRPSWPRLSRKNCLMYRMVWCTLSTLLKQVKELPAHCLMQEDGYTSPDAAATPRGPLALLWKVFFSRLWIHGIMRRHFLTVEKPNYAQTLGRCMLTESGVQSWKTWPMFSNTWMNFTVCMQGREKYVLMSAEELGGFRFGLGLRWEHVANGALEMFPLIHQGHANSEPPTSFIISQHLKHLKRNSPSVSPHPWPKCLTGPVTCFKNSQ